MTLNLRVPEVADLKPKITVFGVGGAGGNAINNMIDQNLDGVEFVVANTDAQALQHSKSTARVQLGEKATEGLGAGARPEVGAIAAEESIEAIVDHLVGCHMCFITAGMGGGTGTGAAPIIAQAARELGVLTVGVVTKPFQFEGTKRMRQADLGVDALQEHVDTLIIIPNQNLFRIANEKTTFTEAFAMADDVLYQGVKGVTDLMIRPGLINLDFADIRSVMDEMGKAMMGTGESTGEDRAIQAAEKAIANPLLDEISLQGAKGVLINITGGHDLTLFELDEAANRIREEVDEEANIIVGSTLDTGMEGVMRVSVVATGIDAKESHRDMPLPRRSLGAPLTSAEISQPTVAAAEPVMEEVVAQVEDAPVAEAAPSLFTPEAEQPAPVREQPSFIPSVAPAAPTYQPQATAAPQAAAPAYEPLPEPVYQARPETHTAPQVHAEAPEQPVLGGGAQPTSETLNRLHAAVNKQPSDGGPTASPQSDFFGQSAEEERPKGFGLNSLISRMTGHAGEKPRVEASPYREQPKISPIPAAPAASDVAPDPESEKIEIPAFLRRQAN